MINFIVRFLVRRSRSVYVAHRSSHAAYITRRVKSIAPAIGGETFMVEKTLGTHWNRWNTRNDTTIICMKQPPEIRRYVFDNTAGV